MTIKIIRTLGVAAGLAVILAVAACGNGAGSNPRAGGEVVDDASTPPVTTAPPVTAASGVEGTWTSVDRDGSDQRLVISRDGGNQFQVEWFDANATSACENVPVTISGQGTLAGDTLSATLSGTCESDPPSPAGPFEVTLRYDAETDTLTDFTGVTWSRADS